MTIQVEQIPPPAPPTVPPPPDFQLPSEIVLPPDFQLGQHFMSGDDIAKIVFISLAGLCVFTWIIARGPIGHAIGDAIKRWLGGARQQELPGAVDDLNRQLDQLHGQFAELAERQDFTERMLAKLRREALPGATDVKG